MIDPHIDDNANGPDALRAIRRRPSKDDSTAFDGSDRTTSLTLDRSGIWIASTQSGAQLLVAVVIAPDTMSPIVTITRYAAPGNGDRFNGAPLTVAPSSPPKVGERIHANLIAVDSKYPAHNEIIYGTTNAIYFSTPVSYIHEVTYDMLVAARMSPPGLTGRAPDVQRH